VTIAQITPVSVLDAIAAGKNTRALLAEHFEVLPMPHGVLATVLAELLSGDVPQVIEHDNGVLHINDLFEQIPHDPEVGQ
jgi:hypothetical protein